MAGTGGMGVLAVLQVLLYTCTFLRVAKPHLFNPISYATMLRRRRPGRCRLRVRQVSVEVMNSMAPKNLHFELDLNAAAFISVKTAITLGLRSGQWTYMMFYCSVEEDSLNRLEIKTTPSHFTLRGRGRGRWIQVLSPSSIEEKEEEEVCLVSPILYHNLQEGNIDMSISVEFVDTTKRSIDTPSDDIKKVLALWNEALGDNMMVKRSPAPASLPNTGREVHVKVIESPLYKCGTELESLLKDYFRIPKLVALGDTLMIPIPSYLGHNFMPSNAIAPPRNIYIKVVKVIGKSATETGHCVHVTVSRTNLYLTGNTHSAVPPHTHRFNGEGDIDVPPVLRETYLRLRKIILMVLKDTAKMNLIPDIQTPECNDSNTAKNITTRMWKNGSNSRTAPQAAKQSHLNTVKTRTVTQSQVPKYSPQNTIKSVTVLLLGAPGQGKEQTIKLAASSLGLGVVWMNCWQLKGDTSGVTEARLHQTFSRVSALAPCVLVLQDVHCLAKDRDGGDDVRVVCALKEEVARLCCQEPQVVLMGTAPDHTTLSDDLWSVWSYQESVGVPGLDERRAMLHWLLPPWLAAVAPPQTLTLAQRTAGYVLGDFLELFHAAQRRCLKRGNEEKKQKEKKDEEEEEQQSPHDVCESYGLSSPKLQYIDLLEALDELQGNRSEALGAPHIPQVHWGEVGGLEEAKKQIINAIQLPLRFPALVAGKLRHSGVLLYGPPGTGKTLLAKAVATECSLNFLSVKGPELLNMYVGQSEENVRQVFRRAQLASPCVIFFDELDSLAPNRGRSGDSGGVMDRIVSALLAELDTVASGSDVFVLGATNRPDLLDPALLRPGRFEKLVFVGVCEDHDGQVKILKAVTSKVPLSPAVSLERVASLLPLSLTGADLYALVTDALYLALHRCTRDLQTATRQHVKEEEKEKEEEEAEFFVTEEDLQEAARSLVPSVSPQELAHYHSLNTLHR